MAETDNVSLILQLTVDAGTLSVSEITDGADSLNITGSGTDRVHIAGTVAQLIIPCHHNFVSAPVLKQQSRSRLWRPMVCWDLILTPLLLQ